MYCMLHVKSIPARPNFFFEKSMVSLLNTGSQITGSTVQSNLCYSQLLDGPLFILLRVVAIDRFSCSILFYHHGLALRVYV